MAKFHVLPTIVWMNICLGGHKITKIKVTGRSCNKCQSCTYSTSQSKDQIAVVDGKSIFSFRAYLVAFLCKIKKIAQTVIQPWWNRLRVSKRGKDTQNHKITKSRHRPFALLLWSWGSQLLRRTGVSVYCKLFPHLSTIIDHTLTHYNTIIIYYYFINSITSYYFPWCLILLLFLFIAFPYSLTGKKGIGRCSRHIEWSLLRCIG